MLLIEATARWRKLLYLQYYVLEVCDDIPGKNTQLWLSFQYLLELQVKGTTDNQT